MSSHSVHGHSTRPRAVIDLRAVASNYAALQKMIGPVRIGASVKADAYGLGLAPISRALYGAGCRTFFVATPGEGKLLRDAIGENSTIYVLNGPAPQDLGLFFKARLKPVLNSPYQVGLWAENARNAKHAPYAAIMIDTGMNRLGLSADDARKLASSKALIDRIGLDHVMSHLACAPNAKHPKNAEQLAEFKDLSSLFPGKTRSLANSAGVYLGRDYHFDMIRPGIALYSNCATHRPKDEVTQPVLALHGTILQIRHVQAGETLGYDATFTAKTNMKIAVAGIGYGDGLPVQLSGTNDRPGGTAIIKGQSVPIVGRISMDLTLLDITGMDIGVGQAAEFFGPHLREAAKRAGTIEYDLMVKLGSRLKRVHPRETPSDAPPEPQKPKRPHVASGARPRPDRGKKPHPQKGQRPRS